MSVKIIDPEHEKETFLTIEIESNLENALSDWQT